MAFLGAGLFFLQASYFKRATVLHRDGFVFRQGVEGVEPRGLRN